MFFITETLTNSNMEIWYYPFIFLVGIFVGFINTLAGGGSLITLPLLIFLGLPPVVANGTSRLGVLWQAGMGSFVFWRKGAHQLKLTAILILPAMIGSFLGAQGAIEMEERLFNKILAAVMLLVLGLIILKPRLKIKKPKALDSCFSPRGILLIITFFAVGLYGGFIQAGIGFVIILTLTYLTPYSLVTVNAIKVTVVFAFNTIAIGYLSGMIKSSGQSDSLWLLEPV